MNTVFSIVRNLFFFGIFIIGNIHAQPAFFIEKQLIDLAIRENYFDSVKTDTVTERNFIRDLFYDKNGKIRKLIRYNLDNGKLHSISNSDKNGNPTGMQLIFYKNGELKVLSMCNNGCIIFEFYENHRLKSYSFIDSNLIPIGYAANYCENGQLKSEWLTDTIRQYYTEYYCHLHKKTEGVFNLIKYYDIGYDFVKTGIWKEYDENGKVIKIINQDQINDSLKKNSTNKYNENRDTTRAATIKEKPKPLINDDLTDFLKEKTSVCADSTTKGVFYVQTFINVSGQATDIHFWIRKDDRWKEISQFEKFNNTQKEIYDIIKNIRWIPAKTDDEQPAGVYIRIPIKCQNN